MHRWEVFSRRFSLRVVAIERREDEEEWWGGIGGGGIVVQRRVGDVRVSAASRGILGDCVARSETVGESERGARRGSVEEF